MRRAPRALLLALALTFTFTLTLTAHSWVKTVTKVDQSIVRVSYPIVDVWQGQVVEYDAVCTGFSIDEKRGYFMTAAHCLNEGSAEGLKVEGFPWKTVLFGDGELDVVVFSADLHRPALRPYTRALFKGQPAGALGFGYGLDGSLFRAGYISHPNLEIGSGFKGYWIVYDTAFVGGMSGGPVFNEQGQVIGLVQLGDNYSGFGHSMSVIYGLTKQFWQW